MSDVAQHRTERHRERSHFGQGWALAACLLLVAGGFLTAMLSTVINQVNSSSELNVVLLIAKWIDAMTAPVALLGLSAAVLRRIALTVIAIVVGVLQLGALVLLLIAILADVSVSASVVSPGPVGLGVVAVALTTVGAVLALSGRTRRWPGVATAAIVVAGVGSLLASYDMEVIGRLFRRADGGQSALSVVAGLVPLSVVLMGLAVALRRWHLAVVAVAALAILAVVQLITVAPALSLIGSGWRGTLLGTFFTVPFVRFLLGAGAAFGLTLALVRARR